MKLSQTPSKINEWIQDGTAVRKSLSLNAIIVDDRLQLRAGGIAKSHVQVLAEYQKGGGVWYPITVFCDPDTGEYRVADGFHRLEAAKKLGQKTVMAHVVQGSYQDALLFAANCNQESRTQLAITPEDRRKALIALLEEGLDKTRYMKDLALVVGVSLSHACKIRTEFRLANGVKITPQAAKRRAAPFRDPVSGSYVAEVNGKKQYLGRSESEAGVRLAELRAPFESAGSLRVSLLARGIQSTCVKWRLGTNAMTALHIGAALLATSDEPSAVRVVGKLVLMRGQDPTIKELIIVVDEREEPCWYAAVRAAGITVMKLSEVIERFSKATDAA